jgi:hypothetical protein
MAYVRNETEKLEVSYPLERIWAAIPEVIKILDWKIEEQDDIAHKVVIKTRGGFMAYSSNLLVEAKSADANITCMTITGETPVTTITSIMDFGRTKDRMGQFIEALGKLMEKKDKQQ